MADVLDRGSRCTSRRPVRTGGSRRPRRSLLHVVIVLGALAMFFPFYWTIVTSLTPGSGLTPTPALIPANPSLEAYAQLFSAAAVRPGRRQQPAARQ